jgi:hypothetical protein
VIQMAFAVLGQQGIDVARLCCGIHVERVSGLGLMLRYWYAASRQFYTGPLPKQLESPACHLLLLPLP